MKAEQVRYGDIRRNSPFYTTNPIEHSGTFPFYANTAADDIFSPDDLVWVCFEAWSRYNPWLKREANGPLGQLVDPLSGLIVAHDEKVR